MNKKNNQLLITGGCGFIGVNLTHALSSDYEIRVIDNLQRPSPSGRTGHPIEFKPKRRSEMARNLANYDKARDILDFKPEHNIEDGLRATWEWFLAQDDAVLDTKATDS